MIFNEHQRNQVKQVAKECGFDTAVYTKNRMMKCINQSKSDNRIQSLIEGDDFKKHCITYFFSDSIPFSLPETTKEQLEIVESDKFDMGSLPSVKLTTEKELWDLNRLDVLALLPISKDYKHNYTHLVARYCYYNEIPFETFYEWRSRKEASDEIMKKWRYTWSRLPMFPPVSIDRIKNLLHIFYPKFKKDKNYSKFVQSFDLDNLKKIETISQREFMPGCVIFNTGMGSGKTAQTIDFLTEDKEFLWITCNIALTNNTEQRFKDAGLSVASYNKFDTKAKNQGILDTQKKLLCTLHSLQYNKKDFPIVVIDEIETVLNIFKTDFLEQKKKLKKQIWETFIRLLKSPQVIFIGRVYNNKDDRPFEKFRNSVHHI
jgi:hypothetical protein